MLTRFGHSSISQRAIRWAVLLGAVSFAVPLAGETPILATVSTLAVEATAEPLQIKVGGPDSVAPGAAAFFPTSGVKLGDPFVLFVVPELPTGQWFTLFDASGQPVGIYSQSVPGVYSVCLVAYDAASKQQVKSTHAVTVGTPVPIPPGPVPPGPTPPGPTPTEKLTVLILHESGDTAKIPVSQLNALNSSKATTYLKQHNADWHKWDDDYAAENQQYMGPIFKQAYERAKTDSKGVLPWVIISNSKEGISAPFPKTEAEYVDLLKKYGGE